MSNDNSNSKMGNSMEGFSEEDKNKGFRSLGHPLDAGDLHMIDEDGHKITKQPVTLNDEQN